jgi:biofilm PGA synthesis N-glycosyltransferase PgaC
MHSSPDGRTIVIISPCRDEEETLDSTIRCMRAQTRTPDLWVIVDDGSKDRTPEILERAASETSWIRVVNNPDRGNRSLGSGVINAFYAGLETVDVDYDFIAKMDVDLEFSPKYIEEILTHFDGDPRLAAASGKLFRLEDERLIEEFIIDEMVVGAFKFYRREAFEKIGGFVREVMWDGIDFHRARMEGYRTASLHDPELRIIHLRLMGSSDRSIYRGRIRWGRGQWFMGTAFLYILASGLFRMREKPVVIGGLLIIWGYLLGALRREPRYDDARFRSELRRWQYQRLGSIFRGRGAS